MIGVEVKNMPKITKSGYVVARPVDGELWYYGVYQEKDKAEEVAEFIGNGVVVEI